MEKSFEIHNIEELAEVETSLSKQLLNSIFPNIVPSIQRTKAFWSELLSFLAKRGKSGLRVVGDILCIH